MTSHSPTIFVGLDCETSARSIAEGARMIQAGIAVRTDEGIEVFCELLGWGGELSWSEDAAAVHNIPRNALDGARTAAEIDEAAQAWLDAHGASGELVSVGFNVASFDHPFFAQDLPGTMARFSHRAVDLNSLCFALDGAEGADGEVWGFEAWKAEAKRVGVAALETRGITGTEHDAGYDAALALEIFAWLREQMAPRR